MLIDDFKLRYILYKQRKTQRELAETTKITRNTINAVCNGKSCSKRTAQKIADALGITLEELQP